MRTLLLIAAVSFVCFSLHAEDSLREYLNDSGAAVDKREVVRIWTAKWCSPCRRLRKEIEATPDLKYRVEWVDADKVPLPADVPNEIPHAEWSNRKWYCIPASLKDLTERWEHTKGLP